MIRKITVYCLCIISLVSVSAKGQSADTAHVLRYLVAQLKELKELSYNYDMQVSFPNGDHDRIKGMAYMNTKDMIYYNDCDAFLMLYTQHRFYKADHRKKQVTIVNMDKDYDKQQKKATERDILKNGAVTGFLDSVLLKTAIVKAIKNGWDTMEMILTFPPKTGVKEMSIVYDRAANQLLKYIMTVYTPWQKTPKGIQAIETTIKCSGFKKTVDKAMYDEKNLFSYTHGKPELKKYNAYSITTKL